MSSLRQDRLLVEGTGSDTGTASTLPSGRGTRRRTVGTPEKQATVPTQRRGAARQSGPTTTTGNSSSTVRTKAATVKAAATKAAATRAATAKAATAKAASAARAAAVTTGANRTAGVRIARADAAAAKPAAPEAAAAKPAAAKPATAQVVTATASTAGASRPTPYKRTPAVAAVPAFEPQADIAELLRGVTPEVVVVREDLPADPSTVAGRLPRFLCRRPAAGHRHPALYLVAALIGSLAVTTVTTGGPEARATATVSHSVSVAEQLGIEASDPTAAIPPEIATERLGELAASRNVRDAEQAAAAQAQVEADQAAAAAAAAAAAEAARPKAVAPVQGARLTSTFGPRWGTLHAGIDLAAPMLTPEFAVMDGVVLEAGPASGYGNVIYIQHENGDVTLYGHMEEILVEAGQVVRAGDTIALLGNRGQSTGPHLHFEVHAGGMNGTKIDPLPWLRERGVAI